MTRIQKPKRTPPKPKQFRVTKCVPLRSLNTNVRIIRTIVRSSRPEMTTVRPTSLEIHIIQQDQILTNVTNTAIPSNMTNQQEEQQRRIDQENFERQLEAAHQVRPW